MDKHSDSENETRAKNEEVDTTEGTSYPILLVAGLAIGSAIGGALIGDTIGFVVGFVAGGAIGGGLQSLVTSRRKG